MPCKLCFPYDSHAKGTSQDEDTGRYLYFRFDNDDQYVVPYHPLILLLWRAHMNLQRITDTQWSYYVLKYASKIEPIAELCCDEHVAAAFGFHGLSVTEMQVVTAALLTKPVSPAEATCIMSGIPIINSNVNVTYVELTPLSEKEVRVNHGQSYIHDFTTPHVMLYINRHEDLVEMSLQDYFTNLRFVSDGCQNVLTVNTSMMISWATKCMSFSSIVLYVILILVRNINRMSSFTS
jgi:hypothetical protein